MEKFPQKNGKFSQKKKYRPQIKKKFPIKIKNFPSGKTPFGKTLLFYFTDILLSYNRNTGKYLNTPSY